MAGTTGQCWNLLEANFRIRTGLPCGLIGTLSAHNGRGLLCLGGSPWSERAGTGIVCLLSSEENDRLCLSAEGSEGEKGLSSEWWEDEAGIGG